MVEPAAWPKSWTGRWTAGDGKSVVIERRRGRILVTVSPKIDEPPYTSAELLGGGTKLVERLSAACWSDPEGRTYLEVDAGTEDLGPTYRLYAAVDNEVGRRPAPPDTPREAVTLVPNTSIGLYDEYEDDVGVPWAYPLEPLCFES